MVMVVRQLHGYGLFFYSILIYKVGYMFELKIFFAISEVYCRYFRNSKVVLFYNHRKRSIFLKETINSNFEILRKLLENL